MHRLLFVLGWAALFGGCINVKLQPVEAHITVDVNVKEDKVLSEVRARMDQRLQQIQALKAQGAVGENNLGFLEVRGGQSEASEIVAAENQDRTMVYADTAKRTNTPVDQVGRTRAIRIAGRSLPGEWVQDQAGDWKKK